MQSLDLARNPVAATPQPNGEARLAAWELPLPVATIAYRQGAEIFSPGEDDARTWRVVSGYVRLFKLLDDGRSVDLALLRPGDLFSSEPPIMAGDTELGAEALTNCTVEVYDRSTLNAALATSPALVAALLASQSRLIACAWQLVEHLVARDAGVRLGRLLLEVGEVAGTTGHDGWVTIDLPLTHQRLANMICANRVTVTRKLLELQEYGAVRFERLRRVAFEPERLRTAVAQLAGAGGD